MTSLTSTITLSGPNGMEDRIDVRFNLAAIDWYEQNSGSKLVYGLTNDMGVRSLIFFLQAGMRFKDQNATYEQVRDRVQTHLDNGGDVSQVTLQLVKALKFFGVLKREEGDAPSPRALPSA